MKNFTKISLLIFFFFSFYKCSNPYELPADLEVNDFVWKGLNAYYLYQDEIPDLSDRRFNSDLELNTYLSDFNDPKSLFKSLLNNEDLKSKLIEDYTNIEEIPLRTSFTHGVEFGIIVEPDTIDNVLGYVSHILPNSDASTKNITRGTFFYAVDTVQLTKDNYLDLLINGKDSLKLKMADFDGEIVTRDTDSVELVKKNYTHLPIFINKTFSIGSKNIGYLMYNNDFSSNYISNLNDVFFNFKNELVTELIIDLRYNIGGGSFAKTVSQMATMITGQFSEEILLKENWNEKAQPWFTLHQPDSLLTLFPEELRHLKPINKLNLTDVYIILNGNGFQGSSTIELLINSLKPYINVKIIGNQTSGNNTGSITLYNSVDYDFLGKSINHTYALQPIVLKFLNAENQTYENGFPPDIELCYFEDILNLGVLGENSDPILNRVLNYVTTGNTGITAPCNPFDLEFLYNSITSQRIDDYGVFIKQDLPNTH